MLKKITAFAIALIVCSTAMAQKPAFQLSYEKVGQWPGGLGY